MLTLRPLQRALEQLHGFTLALDVDRFVRPLRPGDPEAARGEVVLLRSGRKRTELAVLLAPAVLASLRGEPGATVSRFDAWCAALEGVSHFVLLGWRAANDRPVSQLELELQAEIDKFTVALVQRGLHRSSAELERLSRQLDGALFAREGFLDGPETERGVRYRLAARLAARYTRSLARRHLRDGAWEPLVRELRAFYRATPETRFALAAAA